MTNSAEGDPPEGRHNAEPDVSLFSLTTSLESATLFNTTNESISIIPLDATNESIRMNVEAVGKAALTPKPESSLGASSELEELKKLALEAKRSGDMSRARSYMSQIISLRTSQSSLPSARGSKYIELEEKTKLAIEDCRQAVKTSLGRNEKTAGAEWLHKQRALEADLAFVRNAKLKAQPLETQTIKVNVPQNVINDQIPPGEIRLILSDLKIDNKKCQHVSKNDYFIRIHLDNLVPPSKDMAPFKLTNPPLDTLVSWIGVKRGDLRTVKYFEHHKLRMELVRVDSGIFRKSQTIVGTGVVRLQSLLFSNSLEESIELLDESRRGTGVSISLRIALNAPISNKLSGAKTVKWTILSNGNLVRHINQEDPSEEPSLCSYNVLEYEINQLAQHDDPSSLTRRLALETRLEDLTIKINLEQLSMSQYVDRLNEAITKTKKTALLAKRAGNLESARRYIKHVHLMETELGEQ